MDTPPEDFTEEEGFLPADIARQAMDQKAIGRLKSAKMELLSGTDNLHQENDRLAYWRIIYTIEALVWKIRERIF